MGYSSQSVLLYRAYSEMEYVILENLHKNVHTVHSMHTTEMARVGPVLPPCGITDKCKKKKIVCMCDLHVQNMQVTKAYHYDDEFFVTCTVCRTSCKKFILGFKESGSPPHGGCHVDIT